MGRLKKIVEFLKGPEPAQLPVSVKSYTITYDQLKTAFRLQGNVTKVKNLYHKIQVEVKE